MRRRRALREEEAAGVERREGAAVVGTGAAATPADSVVVGRAVAHRVVCAGIEIVLVLWRGCGVGSACPRAAKG